MIAQRLKARNCKQCKQRFTQDRIGQSLCSTECAIASVKSAQARKAKKAAQAERKADKIKREKLKTRSDYIKEAQIAVNKYVRLRDAGRGCISCGAPLVLGGVGGGFDAGHLRSRGAAPHLRFNLDNIHGQCKRCNIYGSGMVVEYRAGLIGRIGLARVEALEADNSEPKWSIQELISIRNEHRAKCKELEKA